MSLNDFRMPTLADKIEEQAEEIEKKAAKVRETLKPDFYIEWTPGQAEEIEKKAAKVEKKTRSKTIIRKLGSKKRK